MPRGGRSAQRGTVSGVGLGSMVWRRYGALGRYAHGAMERHRCNGVERRGHGAVGVMQVWCLERTRRYAMGWRGFGAVGCARCGVIGKCGVRWRLFFGFAARMGKLQKVSKTS